MQPKNSWSDNYNFNSIKVQLERNIVFLRREPANFNSIKVQLERSSLSRGGIRCMFPISIP